MGYATAFLVASNWLYAILRFEEEFELFYLRHLLETAGTSITSILHYWIHASWDFAKKAQYGWFYAYYSDD